MKQTTQSDTKIEFVNLDELIPDSANARKHSERNIEEVMRSLREFGQHAPLVVQKSTSRILVGNGRYEGMLRLEWKGAWVQYVDDDNITAVRRALADNRTAELAEWDKDILSKLVVELGGIKANLPGWDMSELEELLATKTIGFGEPDETINAPEQPVSILGDIWDLGGHRVICGDCTNPNTIEKLLENVKPHLMVTDPPYGVEYDASWRKDKLKKGSGNTAIGKVLNDDRADWSEAWALFPGDVAYVWHGSIHSPEVAASLKKFGFNLRNLIIWGKNTFVISRGNYHFQHEPCWYVVRDKATAHWAGDRKQSTLWLIDKPLKSDTGHSTQKPVECMKKPIENNSNPGQCVYDPFLGSGTTVIAAEMTGRKCYGCELNPPYVDVIVERWEKFTGNKAKLAENGRTFEEVKMGGR